MFEDSKYVAANRQLFAESAGELAAIEDASETPPVLSTEQLRRAAREVAAQGLAPLRAFYAALKWQDERDAVDTIAGELRDIATKADAERAGRPPADMEPMEEIKI